MKCNRIQRGKGESMLDKRTNAMLEYLVHVNTHVTISDLSLRFNISKRTVYNDIDKINDWLKESYQIELRNERGKGFFIDKTYKERILEEIVPSHYPVYDYAKEERVAWIYLLLTLSSKVWYIKDFEEIFLISRNTVINDINQLKDELAVEDIALYASGTDGYVISGDENSIRTNIIFYYEDVIDHQMIYNMLHQVEKVTVHLTFPLVKEVLLVDRLSSIQHYIEKYEHYMKIEITDEVRNSLIILFYFLVERLKRGSFVEVDIAEKDVIHNTEEYVGAFQLVEEIEERLGFAIPENEIVYFTKFLLSAKVNYDLNLKYETKELQQLTKVVEKMIVDFQTYAAVDFPNTDKMVHNLLLHLKATYYRRRYNIQIQNVFKNAIKTNYPEVFYLTKQVIHHFESFINARIDENEIAFIAIHFGGWLRQEGIIIEKQSKKMLIVCTSGLGTSRMLERQLKELFIDVDITGVISLRDYEMMEDVKSGVDFVVSTVSLPDKDVPVFVVEPILSTKDKLHLIKQVNRIYNHSLYGESLTAESIINVVKKYSNVMEEGPLMEELQDLIEMNNASWLPDKNKCIPDLLQLLPKSRMTFSQSVTNWKDAIDMAAQPLLEERFITADYIHEMKKIVQEQGPYIVISDKIALPHAHYSKGVHETGMSLLHLEEPVSLLGKEVQLFIVLATRNDEKHLRALTQLTNIFSNKQVAKKIFNARNAETVYRLIENHLPKLRID